LFVVVGVEVGAEVRATLNGAGTPVRVCVRAVKEGGIHPHGVEWGQRCILIVPVPAERVVPAFSDVAGEDALGEVCGVKGHDAEGTAFGYGIAFCSPRGRNGQSGREGEHAEEGDAELHRGEIRAIDVEKVSMHI
jgi:hypothetical protein